jgi:hypothetical protein
VGVDPALDSLSEKIKAKALAGFNRKYFITAMGPDDGVPASVIEQRALAYTSNILRTGGGRFWCEE